MKTIEMKTEKRVYNSPEIVCIELDNEMSLALASEAPPEGPSETFNSVQNPFKEELGLV